MEYVAKQRHTCQVAPPACCAKTEPSAGDSAYNICRRPHTAPEPSFLGGSASEGGSGSGVVSGDSSEQLRTAPSETGRRKKKRQNLPRFQLLRFLQFVSDLRRRPQPHHPHPCPLTCQFLDICLGMLFVDCSGPSEADGPACKHAALAEL
jgi:hypothetical protein